MFFFSPLYSYYVYRVNAQPEWREFGTFHMFPFHSKLTAFFVNGIWEYCDKIYVVRKLLTDFFIVFTFVNLLMLFI